MASSKLEPRLVPTVDFGHRMRLFEEYLFTAECLFFIIFMMSSGKNNTSDQWLIRNENEQVKGPYSTDAISKMILEGIFSGLEDISSYPDGEWRPLSKQPEFYEVLLESLENPVERDVKRAAKMEAETVIRSTPVAKPEPTDAPSSSLSAEIKALVEKEKENILLPEINNVGEKDPPALNNKLPLHIYQPSAQNKISKSLIQERDDNLTIELEQIKNVQKREVKKLLPLIALVLILAGGIFYFFGLDSGPTASGWALQAPRTGQPALSAAQVKSMKAKSAGYFRTGKLEDLLQAQTLLVNLVEGAPTDLESIGLLCMAYNILWPYTKQGANDLKVFTQVTQKARSINPISGYSDGCQSGYLMAKGQMKDARGLIEKTLDNNLEEKFIITPFLYVMKAEILEDQQNFLNAEAYYSEALKTFPNWNWAAFGVARTLYKQEKHKEARQSYEQILSRTSDFKGSLYGLALIESKAQKNTDKAMDYFSKGFEIRGKLPKFFHVEALLEYTRLLVSRNENSKALDVASQGLQVSPSHRGLKEYVLTLGGSDKSGLNGANELVLTGDQFARNGDHLAAQAQYKAAFEIDSKNSHIPLKIAKSLWELNQGREALQWIDTAIKTDRKNVSAYTLKADYLSQKFNFAESTKAISDANMISPNNYEVLKMQTIIEFRKNNVANAISYGQRAVRLYDADVELLSVLAQSYIRMYNSMPSRTVEEQDLKKETLTMAQKYSGRSVDLEPGWPEAQITYAKYLYIAFDNLKAENYLKELIKNFSYTLEYRFGLAEFYEQDEKYRSAAEIYKQLIELEPKNKKANFGLGMCYKYMNDYSQAMKYFLAAAVIDPSDVEPLYETAQLQLESAVAAGDNAEINLALKKLNAVRTINPNYPKISFAIAKAHLELGQFQEAVEMIKEEKAKNPNLAESYILAAEVYERKGQYKECASEYSNAIKIRTNSAALYVRTATCYRKSDALDIADDMVQMARQKESGLPEVYKEQGYILEKKGLIRQAKESFRLYLELSPNAVDRAEIESKL